MALETSILKAIKKNLNVAADDTAFDQDIMLFANGAFSTLNQLGVGPEDGFFIEDDSAEWDDFVVTSTQQIHLVKTYVYLRVRILFDPPQTGYLVTSQEAQLKEYEWRLSQMREATDYPDPIPDELVDEEV